MEKSKKKLKNPLFSKILKFFKEKKFLAQKKSIPSIEEISLWPELSSPPRFRIQGGSAECYGQKEHGKPCVKYWILVIPVQCIPVYTISVIPDSPLGSWVTPAVQSPCPDHPHTLPRTGQTSLFQTRSYCPPCLDQHHTLPHKEKIQVLRVHALQRKDTINKSKPLQEFETTYF